MASAGLDKLLEHVKKDLSNRKVLNRYLELLSEHDDDQEKIDAIIDLAAIYRDVDLQQALRLLLIVTKYDASHKEVLKLTAEIMKELGQDESAERIMGLSANLESNDISSAPPDKTVKLPAPPSMPPKVDLDFSKGIDFSIGNAQESRSDQFSESIKSSEVSAPFELADLDFSEDPEDVPEPAKEIESIPEKFSIDMDAAEKQSPVNFEVNSKVANDEPNSVPPEAPKEPTMIKSEVDLSDALRSDFTFEPGAHLKKEMELNTGDAFKGSKPEESEPEPSFLQEGNRPELKTASQKTEMIQSSKPEKTSSNLGDYASDRVVESHVEILSELFDFYFRQGMYDLAAELLSDAEGFSKEQSWWRARKVALKGVKQAVGLGLGKEGKQAANRTSTAVEEVAILIKNGALTQAHDLIQKTDWENLELAEAQKVYKALQTIWSRKAIKGFLWEPSDGIDVLSLKIRESTPIRLSKLLGMG